MGLAEELYQILNITTRKFIKGDDSTLDSSSPLIELCASHTQGVFDGYAGICELAVNRDDIDVNKKIQNTLYYILKDHDHSYKIYKMDLTGDLAERLLKLLNIKTEKFKEEKDSTLDSSSLLVEQCASHTQGIFDGCAGVYELIRDKEDVDVDKKLRDALHKVLIKKHPSY